jgi:hypothetical protein
MAANGEGNGAAVKPPINIAVDVPTTDQRRYQFSTFIERDCSPAELNAIVDKITACGQRIRAIGERKIFQETLEKEERDLVKGIRLRAQKDEIDHEDWEKRNKRGDFRRSAQDEANWEKLGQAIEDNKARIAKCREMIAECDRMIGGEG